MDPMAIVVETSNQHLTTMLMDMSIKFSKPK
jgi:hypothetical protein